MTGLSRIPEATGFSRWSFTRLALPLFSVIGTGTNRCEIGRQPGILGFQDAESFAPRRGRQPSIQANNFKCGRIVIGGDECGR